MADGDGGFLWDPAKEAETLRKHNVRFWEVVAVFDDDDAHYDIDEHDGKRRPVVVGCTPLSRILKVIFSDKEVPYLRIITSYEAEGRWLNAYLSRKGVS